MPSCATPTAVARTTAGTWPAAIENRAHEPLDRCLVVVVGAQPAGVGLRLAQRLARVGSQPVGKGGVGAIAALERPGADQGLVNQIFLVCVRRQHASDLGLEAPIDGAPARERRLPLAGHLRQDVDPRAHILAALGVVGRGRRARRATAAAARSSSRGRPPAPARTASDWRRLRSAIPGDCIIQRRVFGPFGGDRAGHLLQLADEPSLLLRPRASSTP